MKKPLKHEGSGGRRLIQMAKRLGWESALPGSRRAKPGAGGYSNYRLSLRELIASSAAGCALMFGTAYLFYRSVPLAAFLSLAGAAAPRFRQRSLTERRRKRLKRQFKEALFSLASSLAAGRSLENAFRSTLDDLKLLYTDPATDILLEFRTICHRLENGEPIEGALRDFAERAQIEEITQFAETLAACKRSGGDLLEVMRRTSTVIGEKLGVEEEINVMIAQKKFEAKMMMAVPFVFLGFLSLAAPDYMAPLYGGIGYALLTAALLLLLCCFWLIHKLMSIRI